jgi:hypothetical protein
MAVKYKFLFNFAVTRTGGGLKRLYHYAQWFHEKGGAWFIIHPNCKFLIKEFPNNKYFVVLQTQAQRLFKDCDYLSDIQKEVGLPVLFYSYGIPIYYRLGKINWFHISNILPFNSRGMGLSLFDRFIKFKILLWKINNNYKNADILSAESYSSLNLIKNNVGEKVLSVNGSDDEINFLRNKCVIEKENIAVVVGTQKYKALFNSYSIFEMLKNKNHMLKLFLIGSRDTIPTELLNNIDVVATGTLQQSEVIDFLKKSKYYISTTLTENSFNAASEGVVFADESYISDIAPHRELFINEHCERLLFPKFPHSIIRVKKEDIVGKNLKLWDDIILELIEKVNKLL